MATVAILIAVAMLSVAFGVVPIQEAEVRRNSNSNGNGGCSGGSSCFSFNQNQINACGGNAFCRNESTTSIFIGGGP
jgi:hypothetical protein